jgi:hypothetical protein
MWNFSADPPLAQEQRIDFPRYFPNLRQREQLRPQRGTRKDNLELLGTP